MERQISQRLGEEIEKVEREVVGREEKARGMVQVGNTPKDMREHGKTQNGDCRGKGGGLMRGKGRDKMAKGQDGGIHDGFDQMGLSGLLI